MNDAAVGKILNELAERNLQLEKEVKSLEKAYLESCKRNDKLRDEIKRMKRKADLDGVNT